MQTSPNPGSDEAIKLGCKCPVLDNARGRGYMGGVKNADGSTAFVYSAACPLHWPEGHVDDGNGVMRHG